MLTSVLEINKAFDETLKKSIPYLIFPHRDYRERLVDLLNGFCQYHRENNQLAFTERYNTIHNFLSECETDGFDTFTTLNIHYLATHQMSLHQIHYNTEIRLRALESDVDNLKKSRKISTKKIDKVVKPVPEIPVIEVITETTGHKERTSEEKSEALINLLKSSFKPLSSNSISNKLGLTNTEIQNRIPRLKRNNSIVVIKGKAKSLMKRADQKFMHSSSINYYIWKDNIPADGIIPDPDDGEFTLQTKEENDLPIQ